VGTAAAGLRLSRELLWAQMPPHGTAILTDENVDGSCPIRVSGMYPVDDPSDTSAEMATCIDEILGYRMDLVDKPRASVIDLGTEIGYIRDHVVVTWNDGDVDHHGNQPCDWKPLS
jgi:hypothetical protein